MKIPSHLQIRRLLQNLALGCWVFVCGCHTAWFASNASGVVHRLASSQTQSRLLADLKDVPVSRSALEALPDLLQFARERGLKVGDAYQRIDPIPGPVSWIVAAADPNTLTLHRWNFPLVGDVPYKGYRFREHAQREADQLTTIGLETEVLEVPAWSSLGWFPEPLPRSLLDQPEYRWATTILHELVHRTIHISSHAELNEGLATYLGHRLALEWQVIRHGEESEPVIQHQMWQRDESRLNRLLRRYREDLATQSRESATQGFLRALREEPWESFSGAHLASQSWSLPRVLLAAVYDPETIDWERIWVETGQNLVNLASWIDREIPGTSQD